MSELSSSSPVKEIMKKTLIFVNPETTVFQVANMMQQGGISAIFVKEDETFVGIVTDRDFAIKIAVNKLSFDIPVKEIMSFPLITFDHNKPISEAAKLMHDKKIRKLAITDGEQIVGILRSLDLAKFVAAV